MKDKIMKIIAEQMSLSEEDQRKLVPAAELKEDLGVDSLDQVELQMVMEEYFDIEIPDELWEKVRTVGDVIQAVEESS